MKPSRASPQSPWRGLAPVLALLLSVGVTVAAAPARADAIVVPDPVAAPEEAELARAVALLVRSYVKPGTRPLVPRRELWLALESLTGRSPGKTLTVETSQGVKLMERLGADGLVLWSLDTSRKGVTVSGTFLGRGGKRLLRIHAAAAAGDVAGLAAQLAKKLAPVMGATMGQTPDVGLGDVRPLIAVELALVENDAAGATRATALAQASVAGRLPAAAEALRALAEDASLPALPRAQARMVRGEWAMAAELADGGLARDPKNAGLRALRVRALATAKNFTAAEQELALLKGTRNLAALALAQVALAIERGADQAERDAAVAPLLGRPPAEWRQVLPLIAATPPGTFGAAVEAAALAAAEKLSAQEPGLVTALATRALAGGAGARATAGMIKVQELSAEQIKALSARLTAEADAAATAGLAQQIKEREEEAKQLAAEAAFPRPTGPPSTLAKNLLPVLEEFDALYEPGLSAIQIAPMPGSGEPFYWPFFVRKNRLADGLLEALMRSPWELRASPTKLDTEILPASRFSEEAVPNLARDLGASAVLLYRIQPAGLAPWVKVELVLHDVGSQRTERLEASLIGRSTGLVRINPLVILLAVLALAAIVAWAVVLSLRGTIQVRVQWDSDAKDELFSILISKEQKTPVIENMTAYRKKLEWLGGRKRRFEAWKIDQNTTFRGIPRGKWYVHLYGVFTRGRQTMVLHEPPQEAMVEPRKTTLVAHVLEAAEAEFRIKVVDDGGPVEGARVWIDEERGKPQVTGKDGLIVFKVQKGYHVIHAVAHGMQVERAHQVVKAKLHEFVINLVWERRQEYVSRALERQSDDVNEYRASARSTGSHPAVSRTSIPVPVQPAADDEVVDLTPAAGHQPVAAAAAPSQRAGVSLQPLVTQPAARASGQRAIAGGQPARRPTGQVPVAPAQPARRATGAVPVAADRATAHPTQAAAAAAPRRTVPAVPAAVPVPEPAAPAAEVPLDLDMSGALFAPPPEAEAAIPIAAPRPRRKPGT